MLWLLENNNIPCNHTGNLAGYISSVKGTLSEKNCPVLPRIKNVIWQFSLKEKLCLPFGICRLSEQAATPADLIQIQFTYKGKQIKNWLNKCNQPHKEKVIITWRFLIITMKYSRMLAWVFKLNTIDFSQILEEISTSPLGCVYVWGVYVWRWLNAKSGTSHLGISPRKDQKWHSMKM